jgi:hypothetical protein
MEATKRLRPICHRCTEQPPQQCFREILWLQAKGLRRHNSCGSCPSSPWLRLWRDWCRHSFLMLTHQVTLAILSPAIAFALRHMPALLRSSDGLPGFLGPLHLRSRPRCRCALKPLLQLVLHCCLAWRHKAALCTRSSRASSLSLQHAHP